MNQLKTFAVLTATTVLFGCSIEADDSGRISLSFGAAETEDFRWDGAIEAGRTLEVKGVHGAIHAERATGETAEVRAVKSGRRNDPSGVEIVVVEHEDGVTLCAVYPDSDTDEPNECLPGDAGHLGARRNDVKVEFTIQVPEGVHFRGRTVNGQIAAEGLSGNVEVRTVNGSARFSTTGHGVARTVNGSITGSLGRADWGGPLEFQTVNGSITLDFETDLNADVEMRTVNGSLDTDFPLTTQGTISRRRLIGTIGSGGRDLTLSTVNGSIKLRRSM